MRQTRRPVFSICIPVFNRKVGVRRAVMSALEQTFQDLEVIVVDNCSTDGTWEEIKALTDPRIRCYRNETNIGMFPNFSRCAALSRGRYVIMLCSDDTLTAGFLEHAKGVLELNSSACLLTSAARLVNDSGRPIRLINTIVPEGLYAGETARHAFFWYNALLGINIFNYPSGIVIRGEELKRALPFRSELGDVADVDFWIRCLFGGNLLVSHFVGCHVTWNTQQASAQGRKIGKHIRELEALAHIHLSGDEDRALLTRSIHLLGASKLKYFLRYFPGTASASNAPARDIYSMLTASVLRVIFLCVQRMGLKFRSPLRRL